MLTDTAIRNFKPRDKPYREWDERGLYVEVTPKGSKLWRFKYRFGKKEQRLSFGKYPAVSLRDARNLRDDARKTLDSGEDPGQKLKAKKRAAVEKSANSFTVVAREWFSKREATWSQSHSSVVIRRLERDIFPYVGDPQSQR